MALLIWISHTVPEVMQKFLLIGFSKVLSALPWFEINSLLRMQMHSLRTLSNYFHQLNVVSLDFSSADNVLKSYFVEEKNTVHKIETKKVNFWQTNCLDQEKLQLP